MNFDLNNLSYKEEDKLNSLAHILKLFAPEQAFTKRELDGIFNLLNGFFTTYKAKMYQNSERKTYNKRWLDDSNIFTKGQYSGKHYETVCRSDIFYINRLLTDQYDGCKAFREAESHHLEELRKIAAETTPNFVRK
jgi:hypothetical protein